MLSSLGYDCFDDYDDCLPPGEDMPFTGMDATPHAKAGRDPFGGASSAQSPQLSATALNADGVMRSPTAVGSGVRMSRRMDSMSMVWDTGSAGRDLSFNDSVAGEVGDGRDDEDADDACLDVDMADADD
jgi:hypothetical protein